MLAVVRALPSLASVAARTKPRFVAACPTPLFPGFHPVVQCPPLGRAFSTEGSLSQLLVRALWLEQCSALRLQLCFYAVLQADVQGAITKVEREVEAVEQKLEAAASEAERVYLRDKERQLRDKERQLRDKEHQLRDKERQLRDEKLKLMPAAPPAAVGEWLSARVSC